MPLISSPKPLCRQLPKKLEKPAHKINKRHSTVDPQQCLSMPFNQGSQHCCRGVYNSLINYSCDSGRLTSSSFSHQHLISAAAHWQLANHLGPFYSFRTAHHQPGSEPPAVRRCGLRRYNQHALPAFTWKATHCRFPSQRLRHASTSPRPGKYDAPDGLGPAGWTSSAAPMPQCTPSMTS